MLNGIHPLLTGELLWRLDAMGHSDAIVISDAHFPAPRVGQPGLVVAGVSAPDIIAAIVSVLPLDTPTPAYLMQTPDGVTDLQYEMLAAAGIALDAAVVFDRAEFYIRAAGAVAVVRTGETRPFGNLILRKGIAVSSLGV